jgi:hypothetical protein
MSSSNVYHVLDTKTSIFVNIKTVESYLWYIRHFMLCLLVFSLPWPNINLANTHWTMVVVGKDCPICPKYKSIMANLYIRIVYGTVLCFQNQLSLYTLVYCYLMKPYLFNLFSGRFENFKFYPEEIWTGFATLTILCFLILKWLFNFY